MTKKTATWKYTLREIVIVIIGISIAFSMNKCADNLQDNKLRNQYLVNLKSDVTSDKIQLEKNIEAINKKLKICARLIPSLNTNTKHGMPLMNDVFSILQYEIFSPKNITYKTLVNSGDFKLIDDFKLKTTIQGHYTNYENMDDAYIRHISLIKDYLGDYMINNADYDQLMEGKTPFLDEIKLKNIVRALTTTYQQKKNATVISLKSCDTLIAEIETVLN